MGDGISCRACGSENPPSARFCASCGSGFGAGCAHCAAPLLPGARFCSQCGAPVTAAAPPGEPGSHPEERRIATILFADLTGFTALSEGADPELLKAVVDRALRRLATEITDHGGHIDKFIGDNVMGVFGAPQAHEDDPERAVRAGLAMQAAMQEINADNQDLPDFALRIGINTGEVLAGNVGGGYTVIGAAVNLASRLEQAAAPGSVTVGETTRARTADTIAYHELGPLELKGLSAPIVAYEAIGARPTHSAGRPAATPLVGRETELQLIGSAIATAVAERRPQLVTILGPAGIGKTRLFAEFTDGLGAGPEAPEVLVGRCPAYGSGSAFWAVREILRAILGVADQDEPGVRESLAEAVGPLIRESGETAGEIASRIARVLGIGGDAAPEPGIAEGTQAKLRRDRFFAAVRLIVEGYATTRPLVIGIEDAQWADDGTLDLIEHLTRWCRAPVALVCMAREELVDRRPGWGSGRRGAIQVRLGPLDPERTRSLIAGLLGDDARAEMLGELSRRCAGNPLFAEEMAKRVREDDSAATLPDTVQAVLSARLDSLDRPARRLVHHASVVGEVFWDGALRSFATGEGIDPELTLARLEELDLIAREPSSRVAGSDQYRFRHGLICEVAYSRLPRAERARKHARTADFLREAGGEQMIAVVAGHYAAAVEAGRDAGLGGEFLDDTRKSALDALEQAGDAAASVHSNLEALDMYDQALALGEGSREARCRIGEKLGDVALRAGRTEEAEGAWAQCASLAAPGEEQLARLRRKLGTALRQRGEREAALEQIQSGLELLKDRQDPSEELVHLYGDAASLYMEGGENMLAIYAAEKSLRLAKQLGEPAIAARAYGTFGRVFGRIGDEEKARDNLERAIECARESDPTELVRALLVLGSHLEAAEYDLDRAARAYEEALELSHKLGDVPAQVELHGGIGRLALRRGERELVASATEAGEALAEREGLTGLSCFSNLTRGWLQWCDGDPAATATLREAEQAGRRIGRIDIVLQALMLQGWVLSSARRHPEADRSFAEALAACERAGLISQSVEAICARAINLARHGSDPGRARELASEAAGIADRLGLATVEAAVLEARGATAADPAEATGMLEQAASSWQALGRPLAGARARTLCGLRASEVDRVRGRTALLTAAELADSLGIAPLASEARLLAADPGEGVAGKPTE